MSKDTKDKLATVIAAGTVQDGDEKETVTGDQYIML